MRLLLLAGLVVALVSPRSSQARVRVDLVVVGGTVVVGSGVCEGQLDCVSAQPGDTVVIRIDVTLGPDDIVTAVDPSLGYDPIAARLETGGSAEALFAMVNGVLLSPVGLPGTDIGEPDPGLADGWELTTPNAEGARGPAAFSLGRAAFSLSGLPTLIGMSGSMGGPNGTRLTREGFAPLSESEIDLAVLRVNVPAASAPASGWAVLLGLAALRRRAGISWRLRRSDARVRARRVLRSDLSRVT